MNWKKNLTLAGLGFLATISNLSMSPLALASSNNPIYQNESNPDLGQNWLVKSSINRMSEGIKISLDPNLVTLAATSDGKFYLENLDPPAAPPAPSGRYVLKFIYPNGSSSAFTIKSNSCGQFIIGSISTGNVRVELKTPNNNTLIKQFQTDDVARSGSLPTCPP